jgi:hypothetical protein
MAVCVAESKPIRFLNNTYKEYLLVLCAVFISLSVFAPFSAVQDLYVHTAPDPEEPEPKSKIKSKNLKEK